MRVILKLNFVKEEGKGIRPAEARTIGLVGGPDRWDRKLHHAAHTAHTAPHATTRGHWRHG